MWSSGAGLPFVSLSRVEFEYRWRHRVSFCMFCSLSVPHSSAKPVQMKSSMTYIQSNRCTEIDIILIIKDGGGIHFRSVALRANF